MFLFRGGDRSALLIFILASFLVGQSSACQVRYPRPGSTYKEQAETFATGFADALVNPPILDHP